MIHITKAFVKYDMCETLTWAKQGLKNLVLMPSLWYICSIEPFIQTEGEIQFGTSINQINITFSGDNNNFTTWNH
jgi:hypothetical protein